jgi:hypothetical protein
MKAPEVHNIGNKQAPPSVFSAPEVRNMGFFAFNYQYCAPLVLKMGMDC